MKKKKFNTILKKITISVMCIFLLSGCTKQLKDENKQVVTNKETGQSITENIICKPTNKEVIKIYEKNKVNISKLPSCDKFNPLKNYGLSIIITCLLIRIVLMPITQKTAMQSEMIKKAQPELNKLEKKYQGKDTQEDQAKKAQEMMMIYQKYKINPLSGCLLSFIQLPLLFGFLEAINRTPALF